METIPWGQWLESVVTDTDRDNRIGRHVFQHACWSVQAHLAKHGEYPIALQKKNGVLTALASDDILPGCLRIPVFCTRDSSYLIETSHFIRSSHEVVGKVKWMSPVNESAERAVEVSCFCQPERRQPAPRDKMKACDYDRNTDCHPFWHIRRSNVVGTFNSAVVGG